MKKTIALILGVLIVFTLSACTQITGEESGHAGKPSDAGEEFGSEPIGDAMQLWPELDGVWAGNSGIYIDFSTDGIDLLYTTGLIDSEYIMEGKLVKATKTGDNSYSLEISFPAQSRMLDDTIRDEAFTETILLTCDLDGEPKTIEVTDVMTDGWVRSFMYRGKTLEDTRVMSIYDAWPRYDGIWAINYEDTLYYSWFKTEDGGTYGYANGVLYSGFSIGGEVTEFIDYPEENRFFARVFVPGVDNEESTIVEQEILVWVDYSEDYDGYLYISNNENDRGFAYKYIAANQDQLGSMSIDEVIERAS